MGQPRVGATIYICISYIYAGASGGPGEEEVADQHSHRMNQRNCYLVHQPWGYASSAFMYMCQWLPYQLSMQTSVFVFPIGNAKDMEGRGRYQVVSVHVVQPGCTETWGRNGRGIDNKCSHANCVTHTAVSVLEMHNVTETHVILHYTSWCVHVYNYKMPSTISFTCDHC